MRSPDGILTLVGEYPDAINAVRVDGTLVARDGCLIFQQANGLVYQPIFPQGATFERLNQKLGSLDRPQQVILGGFDAGGSLPLTIAKSAITKRCPGAPFIFGSIEPQAQAGPAPAPEGPPRATVLPEGSLTPGQIHFMTRYGVSAENARMRLDNEPLVSELSRTLRTDPLPGFSSIWIQHDPSYAVVIAGKATLDQAAVLSRADPILHPHIVFRAAARDQAQIERDSDRIIEAFRPAPGQWAGGYQVETGKFVYDFTSPEGVAFGQANLPPDLKDDVIVRVGSVPVPL